MDGAGGGLCRANRKKIWDGAGGGLYRINGKEILDGAEWGTWSPDPKRSRFGIVQEGDRTEPMGRKF